MSAPNRFDVVHTLESQRLPNLASIGEADDFTAAVAATLHFGSAGIGVVGDPNWGRRRNPSGALSPDVIQYRASGENFDIIVSAGGIGAHIGWSPSTPGEWVAPNQEDVADPDPGPDPGSGGSGPGDTTGESVMLLREIRDNTAQARDSQVSTEHATYDIRAMLRKAAERFGLGV